MISKSSLHGGADLAHRIEAPPNDLAKLLQTLTRRFHAFINETSLADIVRMDGDT